MSEAKHTRGEWKSFGSFVYQIDVDGYKRKIADCLLKPINLITIDEIHEDNANANLIAAAPEMLDELEKQRNKHCFASSGVGDCDTCQNKDDCGLRRVINKAKGVQ